jgi:hypothetical protein
LFDAFPYPTYPGQEINYEQQSASIAGQLPLMQPADVLMFSSIFSFHLAACKNLSNVRIVACTHGPDDRWQHALDATAHLEKTIGVTNAKLYKDLETLDLTNTNLKLLPLLETDSTIQTPKSNLTTIGFFGCQRANKGDHIIKELVSQLHNSYNIILHDGWNNLKIALTNVTNIGFVNNIIDEIKKCDLVIFPHNNDYEKRISGIFIQCVSLGIPCLVPANTTLADIIQESKGGAIFDLLETNSILSTINKITYPDISLNAYNYSIGYNLNNNIDKFIQELL